MVALSDSRVSRLSSFSTLSPWATSTSMTGTLSKSPISGTTISFLLLMTFSLAGMRTEPHVRITKTQTQSYRNRADSALSFFFFSRSQAQPAALLVKIQVAQKTHAQQHGIAVCGADGDCHIMAHNVSQLHLPCAGHPAADRSAAVSRPTGTVRSSPSSPTRLAGTDTRVAPVSTRNLTGRSLILPGATKCPFLSACKITSVRPSTF